MARKNLSEIVRADDEDEGQLKNHYTAKEEDYGINDRSYQVRSKSFLKQWYEFKAQKTSLAIDNLPKVRTGFGIKKKNIDYYFF